MATRQPGSRATGRPGDRAAGQPGDRAAGQPGSRALATPRGAGAWPQGPSYSYRGFHRSEARLFSCKDAHKTWDPGGKGEICEERVLDNLSQYCYDSPMATLNSTAEVIGLRSQVADATHQRVLRRHASREHLRQEISGREQIRVIHETVQILLAGHEVIESDVPGLDPAVVPLTRMRMDQLKGAANLSALLLGKVLPDVRAVELHDEDGKPQNLEKISSVHLLRLVESAMGKIPLVHEPPPEVRDITMEGSHEVVVEAASANEPDEPLSFL